MDTTEKTTYCIVMRWIKQSRQHLKDAGEQYTAHQRFAFRYGMSCMKAGCMAMVHGLIPALFETRASDLVKELAERKRPQE